MSDVFTVKQLREKISSKENVVGLSFVNARGATGTVLDGLSSHGKRQAEMTCITQGCTETHVREQSDWHQSFACRTHSKTKKRGGGSGVGSRIKLADGTDVTFQKVLDTDDADVVALKTENNALFERLKQKKLDEVKADKERRAQERKAKVEADRQARAVKNAQTQREALAANLQRIKDYAARMNLPVSQATLDAVDEAETLATAE